MNSDRDSIIEMQDIPAGHDNDDTNINELFERECLFSIPDDEVKRIQHAVEITIRFILMCIYNYTSFVELVYCKDKVKQVVQSFATSPQVYYTFKDEHLLKVGSFYEKTKNHFPDEFDFVCVIAECDETDYVSMKRLTTAMADIFHDCLNETVLKPLPAGTCIKFVNYKGLHGPAANLEFSYVNSNAAEKSIFVDISPASRVKTQGVLPREMNIKYPEWKDGVITIVGSFLLLKYFSAGHPKRKTRTKLSISEFEQHYMLNEMSDKHKRVYRLLKYLLGNGPVSEALRKLVRSTIITTNSFQKQQYPKVIFDFPSYVIKTLMFHHCLHCRGSSTTISQCVMSVIDHLLRLFKNEETRGYSVSVETMIGDKIEVADNYKSAMIINRSLKKIRNDVFENRATESIPLSKEMLPVVQQHRSGRSSMNRRIRSIVCAVLTLSCFIFTLLMMIMGFIGNQQLRLCWDGTDYIRYMNHSVSVYTNRSEKSSWSNMTNAPTFIQDNSTTIVATGETFCLDYNNAGLRGEQAGRKMTNVFRIYYCGSHNTSSCLSDDNTYLIKVVKNGMEQQLVCRALTADLRTTHSMPNTNVYETGSELACFQKETTCLNIKRKEYIMGDVLISEEALSCEEHQSCMQILSSSTESLHCYTSKTVTDSSKTTQTEICCCEGRECEEDRSDSIAKGFIGFVFFLMVPLALFTCIKSRWPQFCFRIVKRRFCSSGYISSIQNA